MKKGSIRFIYEDGKAPSLEMELADNNLWLTKYEIAHLLNCFVQKIDANLHSIFKEKLLWEDDVCCNNRYCDNNGKEHQMMYYNLEVFTFLCYRIHTLETKVFRQFVNAALRDKLKKNGSKETTANTMWLFNPQHNYWLN